MPKNNFYEEVISERCSLAQALGGYQEGERDPEDGCPMGFSPYALVAKYLWRFQQDGITPVSLEEAREDAIKVWETFKEHYTKKEGTDGDMMSDYILKV